VLHLHSPYTFMVYTGEIFLPSTRTCITGLQGKHNVP